jgi:hypothetical protein
MHFLSAIRFGKAKSRPCSVTPVLIAATGAWIGRQSRLVLKELPETVMYL